MSLLYLVKRDLSGVRYCTVTYNSATFDKVPEQHGHVYLVGLYMAWFLRKRCERIEQAHQKFSVSIQGSQTFLDKEWVSEWFCELRVIWWVSEWLREGTWVVWDRTGSPEILSFFSGFPNTKRVSDSVIMWLFECFVRKEWVR